jgi:hypothetical protein
MFMVLVVLMGKMIEGLAMVVNRTRAKEPVELRCSYHRWLRGPIGPKHPPPTTPPQRQSVDRPHPQAARRTGRWMPELIGQISM